MVILSLSWSCGQILKQQQHLLNEKVMRVLLKTVIPDQLLESSRHLCWKQLTDFLLNMDQQLLTFEKSPQLNWVLWRMFLPVILCSAAVLQSEALLWYWLESCTSFCVKCSGEAFLLRVLNRSACSTMALWWIHAQNFKGNCLLGHGRSISLGLSMCEFPYFSQTSDYRHWRPLKGLESKLCIEGLSLISIFFM